MEAGRRIRRKIPRKLWPHVLVTVWSDAIVSPIDERDVSGYCERELRQSRAEVLSFVFIYSFIRSYLYNKLLKLAYKYIQLSWAELKWNSRALIVLHCRQRVYMGWSWIWWWWWWWWHFRFNFKEWSHRSTFFRSISVFPYLLFLKVFRFHALRMRPIRLLCCCCYCCC